MSTLFDLLWEESLNNSVVPDRNVHSVIHVVVPDLVIPSSGFAASFFEFDSFSCQFFSNGLVNVSIFEVSPFHLNAVTLMDEVEFIGTSPAFLIFSITTFVRSTDSHASPLFAFVSVLALAIMDINSVLLCSMSEVFDFLMVTSSIIASSIVPSVDRVKFKEWFLNLAITTHAVSHAIFMSTSSFVGAPSMMPLKTMILDHLFEMVDHHVWSMIGDAVSMVTKMDGLIKLSWENLTVVVVTKGSDVESMPVEGVSCMSMAVSAIFP